MIISKGGEILKKVIFKVIFTIVLIVLISVIVSSFEPVVSSKFAVNQLQDTYNSNATLTIYERIKDWSWVLYLFIIFIVFINDIKKLIGGKKDETRNS